MRIGADGISGGEYPPDETLRGLRIAGLYVAAISSTSEGSAAVCSKSEAECPSPSYAIRIVNARSRSAASFPTTRSVISLGLSAAGVLAWTETASGASRMTRLLAVAVQPVRYHRLLGRVEILASGDIDPTSLSVAGATVIWTEGGARQARTLACRAPGCPARAPDGRAGPGLSSPRH